MPKYLSSKQKAILKRSQTPETASNYSDAVDQNTWIEQLDKIKLGRLGDYAVKGADYISNLIAGKKLIPTAQSNCTLTATQWVNPNVPISRAETIIKNGNNYGYVEIPEAHILPGDLAIATNPNNNAHHTMLIHGFTKSPQNHNFQGKNYILPADHPLVRYSSGTTHPSGYRRSVGLMEYIDNSEGKTKIQYFRHYTPETTEVLLPEIIVTPEQSLIPKNQKVIKIKPQLKEGGSISEPRDGWTRAQWNDLHQRKLGPSKVQSQSNINISNNNSKSQSNYTSNFRYNSNKNGVVKSASNVAWGKSSRLDESY